MTTFGETIARVRALLEEPSGGQIPPFEARRLLGEAREIANSYAVKGRAFAGLVERQRAALRKLEAELVARR